MERVTKHDATQGWPTHLWTDAVITTAGQKVLRRLKPYAVKVARTVLEGAIFSNGCRLPG